MWLFSPTHAFSGGFWQISLKGSSGLSGTLGPGAPENLGRTHLDPKSKKMLFVFFNFISAKNLLKMHGWVKITPLQNAKMLFSQNPLVKISRNLTW